MASIQGAVKDLAGSAGETSLAAGPEGLFGRRGTCATDVQAVDLFYVLPPSRYATKVLPTVQHIAISFLPSHDDTLLYC